MVINRLRHEVERGEGSLVTDGFGYALMLGSLGMF